MSILNRSIRFSDMAITSVKNEVKEIGASTMNA